MEVHSEEVGFAHNRGSLFWRCWTRWWTPRNCERCGTRFYQRHPRHAYCTNACFMEEWRKAVKNFFTPPTKEELEQAQEWMRDRKEAS